MKTFQQNCINKVLKLSIIAIFALVLLIPAKNAYAGYDNQVIPYAKNITLITSPPEKSTHCMYYLDLGKKIKNATKVTVDYNGVIMANAYKYDYMTDYNVTVTALEPGSGKLTVKVWKNGTKKTYKINVKVVKYKNPVKSLKIGSKEYAKKFKNNDILGNVKFPVSKKKISIKPASGWKVKSIVAYAGPEQNAVKAKNNSTFNFKKWEPVRNILVTLENKKTKAVQQLFVNSF